MKFHKYFIISAFLLAVYSEVEAVNLRDLNIPIQKDFVAKIYKKECSVCHGETLRGAAQGTPLVGIELQHGSEIIEIAKSISQGFPDRGMPAWSSVLNENKVFAIAMYIAEQRQGTNLDDFRYDASVVVPQGIIRTKEHNFTVETVISDLDALPFGIAPLPDGTILLTEKRLGLSIVSQDGDRSELIAGTPKAYDDSFQFVGQPMGLGWMMDVALHPDYLNNSWIYLHFGDRCSGCNEMSLNEDQPVSMNKLVRGRIKGGAWVDEEVIWEADKETYTSMPEIAAGGRIAFDNDGFVYFSVGMKGPMEHIGVQDLSLPYGKIMRVHDDGRIPLDNPFLKDSNAIKAIWSYGHRNPQGLEFNNETNELWSSEMGPRGGDEINLIQPGLNYGWPLISKGVDYTGKPLNFAKLLGIEFDINNMVQPLVDLTPAPAISSFIFYQGEQFPEWAGNIIIGSLRASDLMRLEFEQKNLVSTEYLLKDIARFRDIEVGYDGSIYVLLENDSGGRILKISRSTIDGL
jgi:glucose/arabinose dehydrogenase